ncbi:MAG: histidine kinase dimerization/phosphoacceptor domain -containing protein [Pseudomonadota bacterium]
MAGIGSKASRSKTAKPAVPFGPAERAALEQELAGQKRIEAELRATIAAQDLLFRKLSHRLKNNLQLVISIISLRLSALQDATSRRELEDMLAKVHALALIQKKLHDGGRLLAVDFGGFLRDLTANARAAARRARAPGRGRARADRRRIERAVPLGLIANELIAMAAQSDAGPPLKVTLAQRDGKAVLTIGPIAPAILTEPGRPDLGMPLVRALARQAQAELTIDPSDSPSVHLRFDAEGTT